MFWCFVFISIFVFVFVLFCFVFVLFCFWICFVLFCFVLFYLFGFATIAEISSLGPKIGAPRSSISGSKGRGTLKVKLNTCTLLKGSPLVKN